MGASLVIRLWATLLLVQAAAMIGEVRHLEEGPVQGTCSGTVCEFLGLPYAAAPVHDLRWRPPQAMTPWKTLRSARAFGNNCLQVKGKSIIGNEDCLFLNIWAPRQCHSAASNASCSVMFWIHGGSYVTGGTKDMFNGTQLAKEFGVIIVTVNYRLGILGFAGADALRTRDPSTNSTGNYGIQDQRAAMQWVHRNIHAFGGNSSELVLFGESAGAGSIAVHLTSPLSWPWYRRVIMQSGAFSYWNSQPMEDAERQFQVLLEATKCGHSISCLLSKPADELTGLATVELNPEPLPEAWKAYGTFFSPTVDGIQLKDFPWKLLSDGRINQVQVLLGFNKDEGTVLSACEGTPKCQTLHKGSAMKESDFKNLMTRDLFNISEAELPELLNVYVPDSEEKDNHDWYWIVAEIYGDYSIACPSLRAADQLSNITDTYLYRFAHTPKGHAPKWAGIFGENGTVGASHAAELGFVWLGADGWNASTGDGGWELQKDERPLAETMATYWTNFAKSGNPNIPRNGTSLSVSWPMAHHATTLTFASSLDVAELSHLRRRCKLLEPFGAMVEGYTQTRRLKSKDEFALLI